MQSDQQRAIWAVLLSGIVLFLWQYFFVPQISPSKVPQQEIVQTDVKDSSANISEGNANSPTKLPEEKVESFYHLTTQNFKFKISNELKVVDISSVNSSELFQNTIGSDGNIFLNFYSPDKKTLTGYTFEKLQDNQLAISHTDGLKVVLTLDDMGRVKIEGQLPKGFGYGVSGRTQEVDSALHKRLFSYNLGDLSTVDVGDDSKDSGTLKWIGVDYSYHFFGFININAVATDVMFNTQGYFDSKCFPMNDEINSYFILVKKEYDFLKSLGDSLHLAVDFGFFAFLAVPMLWLLKFFYGLVSNFGVAIILLTVLIRFLTFPLQWSSLKGMKKMQVLQPQLAKLKEKYKDDPMTMQKETMELFKRSGVNPLSGCFPLLLQMPIFFALYSVLYNAVELVGADFMGWIHDLSAKDPYYVLPIAMAASMFLQQKITPTTITDKMQQRIFLFMPLIFGFFMKDLPSGLSLYIFVSTLVGILQQIFVFSRIK